MLDIILVIGTLNSEENAQIEETIDEKNIRDHIA